jgi:hypothetical protein
VQSLEQNRSEKSEIHLTVLADEKSIEKRIDLGRARAILREGRSETSHEIVVFDVGKNQISGYLATPKDTVAPHRLASPAATPVQPSLEP